MTPIEGLLPAIRILHFLAAFLAAVLVLRGRREHAPVADLLLATAVGREAAMLVASGLLNPAVAAAAGAPVHGIGRAAGHLHQGLQLAWPAAVTTLALIVFPAPCSTRMVQGLDGPVLERRQGAPRWLPWAAWLTCWLFFAVTYPATRELHAAGYAAGAVACVSTGWLTIGRWWSSRERMRLRHVCALAVVVAESCVLAGPYRTGIFGSGWDGARGVYLGLYVMLVLIQGGALWVSRSKG